MKTVLITGCSRGIGYETALFLAEHGYNVYATVRSLSNSSQLISQARSFSNLVIRELDVTKPSTISDVVTEILKEKHSIDIVINNAVQVFFGPIETLTLEEIKIQFDVNFFGAIAVTQAVLPSMRNQRKGHICFLSSTSGVSSCGMYGSYASSKFALEGAVHSLAATLFHWNIHISLIENSATSTNLATQSLHLGSRFQGKYNPYQSYTSNALEFLRNILRNGHSPKDVAMLIKKAVEEENPKYRYFTSKKAEEIFANQLIDPSGENWLQADRDLADKWFCME